MPIIDLVRVFVDAEGNFGSVLTVVRESADLTDAECARIARTAGTSETVFLDDPAGGQVRIFVPAGRIPFAGYPVVGAGWLLRRCGIEVDRISTGAAGAAVHPTDDGCSIECPPRQGNPWQFVQLAGPEQVAAASSDGADRHDYVWAWEDEAGGHVRARAFSSASGKREDEATGSAAIDLCAELGRELVIRQGLGSLIAVQPVSGGHIRLSGRVRSDQPG